MNKEKSKNHKKNENFKTLDQKLEHLQWYTYIEYAYSDVGVDKAMAYKTGICYKGRCYEIMVYPMKLISKNLRGWEYQIYTLKNGEIIDEYDAGVDTYDHFSIPEETKKASVLTLEEMLEE
jgi:hypothetical protein